MTCSVVTAGHLSGEVDQPAKRIAGRHTSRGEPERLCARTRSQPSVPRCAQEPWALLSGLAREMISQIMIMRSMTTLPGVQGTAGCDSQRGLGAPCCLDAVSARVIDLRALSVNGPIPRAWPKPRGPRFRAA